jgi:hypothetical protein
VKKKWAKAVKAVAVNQAQRVINQAVEETTHQQNKLIQREEKTSLPFFI